MNGTVEIAATMKMIIGICIATIVYVLIQLLEAPPQQPLQQQPLPQQPLPQQPLPQRLLQQPVKTFGKQRNAKR